MTRRRVQMLRGLLTGVILLASLPAARTQQTFVSEYRLDTPVVEIPFEYRQHQILVHGTIGTHRNLTFLFDTGATAPVLDTTLGIRGYHLADPTIQEAEGQTKAEEIWVDDMSLGPDAHAARVHNIAVLQLDLTNFAQALGERVDGIVGISFAAGFVTEIDYARKVLRFHNIRDVDIAALKPDNQRTFLFDLTAVNGRKPISTLQLSGLLHPKYDYNFLLDTGFGGYVSVAHAAAQEAGLINDDTPRVVATSYSLNNHFRSEKIRAPFLALGEINLSNRIVQVDYRNKDIEGQFGIVGNRFLQNYRVTLDSYRKKLYLERVTTKEEPDDANQLSFGLVLKAVGKSVKIDRVKKYSPAQKAGVRAGDEIVSINGQEVSEMSLQEVSNALSAPQGMLQFLFHRGADPNLGTGGDAYTLNLTPTSPLDWTTN